MSKIHLLDEDTINKIAAGEVVERAASVVKELVENSIDAGAKRITIDIRADAKNITGISVSDDGCGVSAEDALLAFQQHATSKITGPEDLNGIATLGFRGEALASIAAVSKVTFTSKERESASPEAVQLIIHGGNLIKQSSAGAPDGTTIIVEDLFYNTPARKKFQKSLSTELSHIYDMVERIALSCRNTAIILLFNGKERFRTYGNGSYPDAVAAVFGTGFAKSLIQAEGSNQAASVSGWITKPGCEMRPTPSRFYLTINGRQITSRTLQWAVREGYGTLLPKGMYPAAFLDIKVDLREVDVNVHPTKREVRISREREVASAVQDAVYCALHDEKIFAQKKEADAQTKLISREPDTEFGKKKAAGEQKSAGKQSAEKIYSIPTGTVSSKENTDTTKSSLTEKVYSALNSCFGQKTVDPVVSETAAVSYAQNYDAGGSKPYTPVSAPQITPEPTYVIEQKYPAPSYSTPRKTEQQLKRTERIIFGDKEKSAESKAAFPIPEILGQISGTYILAKDAAGNLLIIDQHAAHERIMYDSLVKKAADKQAGQELISPVTLTLSRAEAAVLPTLLPALEKAGYVIEPFGQDVWAVRCVPVISSKLGDPSVVHEIIAELCGDAEKNPERALDRVLKTAACRAVVKGNTALTFAQMEDLLRQLAQTDSPYTCPHGRPTVITLSKEELEKMFLRT
ncbi:MAG TPA: DNA mismatch repair endonuclease MutL [Methanocorpusculum sp.]|nr:DNA mismatch repair endonuclease MutL [Methanocorpusculum sp.]